MGRMQKWKRWCNSRIHACVCLWTGSKRFCNQIFSHIGTDYNLLFDPGSEINFFSNQPFRQLDNNNINLSSQQFCRSHFTCKYFYWVFSRAWCVSATFCIADYCYVKHTVEKWPGHAPNSRLLLTQFPPFKFHILLSVKLRSSDSTISVVRYLGNR